MMMTKLGNEVTDAEVRDIITEAGSSKPTGITYSEFQKPHYLRGGSIGRVPILWDPVGQMLRGAPITDTLPEDVRAAKRNSELANGRLAMIGAMGFSAHYMIEGSVPFVFGNY